MRFLVLIGVVLSFATTGTAQGQDGFQGPVPYSENGWASALEANSEGSGLAPTGWLIDFRDDTSLDVMANVLSFIGHRLGSKTRPGSGQRVVVPSLSDRFKQWLRQSEYVESVEPNQILSLFQEAPSEPPRGKIENPDDPMYASQWHFDMIHLEDAWKNADGEDVIVAVIDTGVSFGKLDGKKSKYPRVPDLRQTKFVAGYNFVDKNDDPADGNGHGTHVAGTIAQSTNNGIGVAGIAPRAAIMPIKVLSDRGSGSLGDISKGIRFAADHGAHVINMSLGGGFYSPSMHRAIKYAHDKGVTWSVLRVIQVNRERISARYPECSRISGRA